MKNDNVWNEDLLGVSKIKLCCACRVNGQMHFLPNNPWFHVPGMCLIYAIEFTSVILSENSLVNFFGAVFPNLINHKTQLCWGYFFAVAQITGEMKVAFPPSIPRLSVFF